MFVYFTSLFAQEIPQKLPFHKDFALLTKFDREKLTLYAQSKTWRLLLALLGREEDEYSI